MIIFEGIPTYYEMTQVLVIVLIGLMLTKPLMSYIEKGCVSPKNNERSGNGK